VWLEHISTWQHSHGSYRLNKHSHNDSPLIIHTVMLGFHTKTRSYSNLYLYQTQQHVQIKRNLFHSSSSMNRLPWLEIWSNNERLRWLSPSWSPTWCTKFLLLTYNTFIKILYMFRALPCSSSRGLRRNCIYAASGIVTVCKKWVVSIRGCIHAVTT
jgi:hypothetical protein